MNQFYQVSTLNALMLGYYNGTVSVKEAVQHGDFGIGTYDGLDGEMIVWDKKAYDGRADGRAYPMNEDDQVAFCCLFNFDDEAKSLTIKDCDNLEEFKKILNQKIETEFNGNQNIFYGLKAQGTFKTMHVRSCHKQQVPYKPLSQVACDQMEYETIDEEGMLTALWCPKYVDGINMPGWHVHYLSSDLQRGGHVLGLAPLDITLSIQPLSQFDLVLPKSVEFGHLDLTRDLKKETEKVEGAKK